MPTPPLIEASPGPPSPPAEPLDEVNFWKPSPNSQFRAVRSGWRAFKEIVAKVYRRACAILEEHLLPGVEAAAIKPYGESAPHEVFNGLLLRSDVCLIFYRGYISSIADYPIKATRLFRKESKRAHPLNTFQGRKISRFPFNHYSWHLREMISYYNERFFGAIV